MSATLLLPCSWDPDNHCPGPVETVCNRTEFQLGFIQALSKRPRFLHLCGNPSLPEGHLYRGPVVIMWFERAENGSNAVMHAIRLGANRVLQAEYVPNPEGFPS